MGPRIGPIAPLCRIERVDETGLEHLACGHTVAPPEGHGDKPAKLRRCPACPSSLDGSYSAERERERWRKAGERRRAKREGAA